ncbi:MAG: hypothetical protein QXN51_05035, partial [Ignisphaera sp.]
MLISIVFVLCLLEALGGDGSDAPSHPGLELDGSPVPLGSTATHEPIQILVSVWMRWKSLDTKEHKQTKMNIQGQTDPHQRTTTQRLLWDSIQKFNTLKGRKSDSCWKV